MFRNYWVGLGPTDPYKLALLHLDIIKLTKGAHVEIYLLNDVIKDFITIFKIYPTKQFSNYNILKNKIGFSARILVSPI